jgi:hypothetical protein
MKTRIQQPKQESRTIQSKTKASNQASIAEVLQKYRDKTVQRAGFEEEEPLQGKFETAQRADFDEEELMQGKFETAQREAPDEEELLQGKFAGDNLVQREAAPNRTGLPDNLKSGIEAASGYSMDDVRVHYNSPKPAQLQALAYTQGTDIHVAPGQEKHLPHEAWHVVQQKQGRVQPTMQLQGVNINDNEGLEREADVMGGRITVQRLAYAATRPLGQHPIQGPLLPGISFDQEQNHDWNLGFGNLKINHRHIIFSDRQVLPTGQQDNIGFHCADGNVYGTGELFSEEWRRFGYTRRNIISKTGVEDLRLVAAINGRNPPGNYNLVRHNCQDWVNDVVSTFEEEKKKEDFENNEDTSTWD